MNQIFTVNWSAVDRSSDIEIHPCCEKELPANLHRVGSHVNDLSILYWL